MTMRKTLCTIALGSLLTGAVLLVAGWFPERLVVSDALAVIGRPATPGSVAGVARRTTRRVIRRSTIYIATLPAGCTTVVIEGVTLHQCGATYYQPYKAQYVVVYVD